MKSLWKAQIIFAGFILLALFWLEKPRPMKNPDIKPVNVQSVQQTSIVINEVKKVKKIVDKKIELNPDGNKIHVLLMAHFRTGSTYYGQLMAQFNQTYYNYEPLHYYSSRANNWTHFSNEQALFLIQNIYKCDFTSPEVREYISNGSMSMGMSRQLKYFKDHCHSRQNCSDPDLHTELCINSNMNLIKTVRLRAHLLRPLLKEDPKLKIIALFRDPRAVINSRIRGFCGKKM